MDTNGLEEVRPAPPTSSKQPRATCRLRISAQVTSCPICAHPYEVQDNSSRVPVSCIPCLHTICRGCVTAIAARGSTECPSCRTPLSIPASDLPRNYALVAVLEVLLQNSEAPSTRPLPTPACELCTQGGPAEKYCVTCAASVCAECSAAHAKMTLFRGHVLQEVSAPRALSKLAAVPIPQLCKEHQDIIRYVCSCEQLICRDCQDSKSHAGHTRMLISEVADDRKRDLLLMADAVDERASAVQVAVAALGACVAQLGEQRDAAVSRIRERTTALVAFANAREAALMEDVAAAHRRAEIPLVAQRELLQVVIDGRSEY